MGMKKISVVGEKKGHIRTKSPLQDEDGTSGQEKIPRATKIIRDLDRTRKKRYM